MSTQADDEPAVRRVQRAFVKARLASKDYRPDTGAGGIDDGLRAAEAEFVKRFGKPPAAGEIEALCRVTPRIQQDAA